MKAASDERQESLLKANPVAWKAFVMFESSAFSIVEALGLVIFGPPLPLWEMDRFSWVCLKVWRSQKWKLAFWPPKSS